MIEWMHMQEEMKKRRKKMRIQDTAPYLTKVRSVISAEIKMMV
jgi:hypothetical protein